MLQSGNNKNNCNNITTSNNPDLNNNPKDDLPTASSKENEDLNLLQRSSGIDVGNDFQSDVDANADADNSGDDGKILSASFFPKPKKNSSVRNFESQIYFLTLLLASLSVTL